MPDVPSGLPESRAYALPHPAPYGFGWKNVGVTVTAMTGGRGYPKITVIIVMTVTHTDYPPKKGR